MSDNAKSSPPSHIGATVPRNLIELNRQQHIAMICSTTKQSQRRVFSVILLKLLILLACSLTTPTTTRTTFAGAASIDKLNSNATLVPRHGRGGGNATGFLAPHAERQRAPANITILHEVPTAGDESTTGSEKPLVLNTHEVLPLKPLKKKPYTLLDKDIITEYEKQRPLKKYELSPIVFDFNLGDLEDLEHESAIKKGDLSSEEKHLLRNSEGETEDPTVAGVRYSEHSLEDDVQVKVDMEGGGGPSDFSGTTTKTATSSSSPATTSEAAAKKDTSTEIPLVVTVGPHIFKVAKNKNSKKGRELMQKDEPHKGFSSALNFNSVSRYFGLEMGDSESNVTAATLREANIFQIVTNLYDHFYWQAADIQREVSTACGLEMQAYLTALHGNYEWAQRAYDSSGRYRGQLMYGNDKWIGQMQFCNELNHQLRPDERKHFEFDFSMAVIALRLWLPEKLDINLQVGECLPTTCSSHDVLGILKLDPHARMLGALAATGPAPGGDAAAAAGINATDNSVAPLVQVRGVRKVPGNFSYWGEVKFQLFLSFSFILLLVVAAATWYQAKLNDSQMTAAIPAISAKVDSANGGAAAAAAVSAAALASAGGASNGKPYELYQMKTLNENNNIVEIDGQDLGGEHAQSNGDSSQVHGIGARREDKGGKSLAGDCKLDNVSSAGADGTFEAKKELGLPEQVLLCFAFQTNAKNILNIDSNKESQTSCVHGLRVISLLWTIMVHTYLQMFMISENRFKRVIVERSMWYEIVGNATFSVDTFFYISGFLVTLLYLKKAKKFTEEGVQFVRRSITDTSVLWLYRYLRLTPVYLFVIFFNDFSMRDAFDKAVFRPNAVPSSTCHQYWWRNILYINNFYPLSEICMIWSWYMANDMQFYIMATCLLILSTRYFKTAVLVVLSFLLSSWAVSGVVSLHYHYTHKVAFPFESFDFLYDKPWQRVGPYIMGMITGYIVYKVKTPPKISNRTNYLLWAGSLGLLVLIIFGVWQGQLSEISTAFYVGVGHSAFGLSLVWIVLSCCWGYTPLINRILSYRCLWPLSRLTYCTYLIHPILMLLVSFRMLGTVHLNIGFIMIVFLGNAVVSFGVAFFISVLLEAPVIRLLKISFHK